MNPLQASNKIFIARSHIPGGGRGVFATHTLKRGDLIERCPVIELPTEDVPYLRETILHNYCFLWGKKHNQLAVCLGFGSLYNHSYTPNATYQKNITQNLIDFVALKDIEPNEEITVNYNFGNASDQTTLWIKEIPPATTT